MNQKGTDVVISAKCSAFGEGFLTTLEDAHRCCGLHRFQTRGFRANQLGLVEGPDDPTIGIAAINDLVTACTVLSIVLFTPCRLGLIDRRKKRRPLW